MLSPHEMNLWLYRLLRFALKSYPDKLRTSPLSGLVSRVEFPKNPHRVNGDGAADRGPATVTLTLPDEAARNLEALRRQDPKGDVWFLVRVRRDVQERFTSPIKLDKEV